MLEDDGLNKMAEGEMSNSRNLKGSLALGSKVFLHEISSTLYGLSPVFAKPPRWALGASWARPMGWHCL